MMKPGVTLLNVSRGGLIDTRRRRGREAFRLRLLYYRLNTRVFVHIIQQGCGCVWRTRGSHCRRHGTRSWSELDAAAAAPGRCEARVPLACPPQNPTRVNTRACARCAGALLDGVRSGRIAGAGLDVYEKEGEARAPPLPARACPEPRARLGGRAGCGPCSG